MTNRFILGPDDVRRTASEHAAAFPAATASDMAASAIPAETEFKSATDSETGVEATPVSRLSTKQKGTK